MLFGQFAC